MHGFKDKFEYYAAGTPAGRLHQIKIPVFAFHSGDDWVSPEHLVPKEEIMKDGSNVAVVFTDMGAHCCHFTGLTLWPDQYYPIPIVKFFNFMQQDDKKTRSRIRPDLLVACF